MRNLSALAEPEGRAQALLDCQAERATLVVTYQGELLSTRQLELALLPAEAPAETDDDNLHKAYDQAGTVCRARPTAVTPTCPPAAAS